MRNFKTRGAAKYLFLLIAAGVAVLTSCKTNDDPNPTATVKLAAFVSVTNALEGSAAQDFYLDGAKQNGAGITYGTSTSYFTSVEGDHTGKFTTTGSTTANVDVNATFTGQQYYSIYYTGSTNASTSYVVAVDDLTAPAAGKAKVRFIHLSQAVSGGVDFGINATTKLVTNLAYRAVSAYQTVDANTTFFLYAAGSTTVALPIAATIQAGKIYTIYVSGNTTASLKYNIVAQN